MKGFKSFADKTEIDFESGVSCIVGPNGSGKSNITDAVRWVLGEQKVKSLRGSKMEDVIFNGTKHRKQLGLAEVSLIFDNTESFFPIDFQEVKVTRRVFRSGDSEYLINNSTCRLKELKELFMDTGLGTEGYSIIGQGKIDSILSTNKEERRQIFEEAAGIVKYKGRKKEAERKLETTKLNLLRVEDIFGELNDRIGPLKIESEKAKKYIEYSEELKTVEINVFLNNADRIDEKLTKENNSETLLNTQIEEKSKVLFELKSTQRESNAKFETLNEIINTSKEMYFNAINRIKSLEGEESVLKEKLSNFNESMTRLETEITGNEKTIKAHNDDLTVVMHDRSELKSKIESINKDIESISNEYDQKAKSLSEHESLNEGLKSEIIDNLNQVEKHKSEIASLNMIIDSFVSRIEEIDLSLKEINEFINSSTRTMENLKFDLDNKDNALSELIEERDTIAIEYKNIMVEKNEAKLLINNLASESVKLSTEKKMLEDMEKSHEGFDYSVKSAMKYVESESLNGFHGAVASLMQLPAELETAIDISLGKSMQNIVCDSSKLAHRVINYLKKESKGRATFLPLDSVKTFGKPRLDNALVKENGYLGIASNLIKYDDKFKTIFEYLLGRTIIVKDYDAAIKISKAYDTRCKIVTLEGEVINTSGAITGGSFKAKISNILSRKRKIEDTGKKLLELADEIESKNAELLLFEKKLSEIESRGTVVADEIEDNKQLVYKVKSELSVLENEMKSKTSSHEKNHSDKSRLTEELEKSNIEIVNTNEKIEKLVLRRAEIESKLSLHSTDINELVNVTEALKRDLTAKQIEEASVKEKLDSSEKEITRMESSIRTIEGDIKVKFSQLDDIKTLKDDALNDMDKVMTDLAEVFKSKDILTKESDEQKIELEELKTSLDKMLADIYNESSELDKLKEGFMAIEIRKAKLDTEKENIVTNLWEKYEMNISDAIVFRSDAHVENPSKVMNKLKKDIRALGDVSIHTIEEYEEVKEKYEFLKEQHDDLLKAAKSLQKVINGLEETMIAKFKETMEEVNKNFNDIFVDLFNGGTANLVPENDEELLDCNIEIIAQPPGKKLQNLNLLSGGEKALTAIALLFSILRIKPSPFCILDEIEAALDDVNVHRFAEFISNFTDKSQFVVITHRKGTMEVADSLYGVTMEEFGVSKLVSVKLEEAVI